MFRNTELLTVPANWTGNPIIKRAEVRDDCVADDTCKSSPSLLAGTGR